MEESQRYLIKKMCRDDKAFRTILNMFLEYLKNQDKLNMADDLLPEMNYTYLSGYNGADPTRCILRRGFMPPNSYDAVINIEWHSLDKPGCALQIFHHETGLPLAEGWGKPNRI